MVRFQGLPRVLAASDTLQRAKIVHHLNSAGRQGAHVRQRIHVPHACVHNGHSDYPETHVIRGIFALLLTPLWRLAVRLLPVADPWKRIDTQPRLRMYGGGARLDFSKYLEGPSLVPVGSLAEVQDWLLGCRYEHDEVLFGEADFWQHPSTFERLRAGDCEDFAVWTWRKLVELGYDVHLVAGWCVRGGELTGRHAWLLLRKEGVEYVFEPAAKERSQMLRPLAEVRDAYVPQFGVDRSAKRFAFSGYVLGERQRLAKRRPVRRLA
jgi:hypothetical protein